MTDSPGEDGVAGDHQVVDGQRDQGAVVGGHTGCPQDLNNHAITLLLMLRMSYVKQRCTVLSRIEML